MTSRDSRFDKLEEAKPVTATSGESGLSRFEEDGATSLKLDSDPLTELPMLQCPSCQLESSKWDAKCIHCGASLTAPEAVAHNRQLVETRRLAKDTELEVSKENRDAAMRERANEQAEAILAEARKARDADVMTRRLIGGAVAAASVIMPFTVSSYLLKVTFFLIFLAALTAVFKR